MTKKKKTSRKKAGLKAKAPRVAKQKEKLLKPIEEELSLEFTELTTEFDIAKATNVKKKNSLIEKAEIAFKKGFAFSTFDLRHSKPKMDEKATLSLLAKEEIATPVIYQEVVDADQFTANYVAMKDLLESLKFPVEDYAIPMVNVVTGPDWDSAVQQLTAKGIEIPMTPVKITVAKARSKKA